MVHVKISVLHTLSTSLTLAFAAAFLPAYVPAQVTQDTTTTLTTLRSNNTAASGSFRGAYTDLPKPGNISPLPMSTLVPGGDQTRYIAHLMPWFKVGCNKPDGKCSHTDVSGYQSDDTAQVVKQLTDMNRRGFSAVFVDWYGYEQDHSFENNVTQKVMHEAERLKSQGVDFSFAVMLDKGIAAFKCGMDEGCNTQRLLAALLYAYQTYEQSPAYLRFNGRPVVPFFWGDQAHPVNWDEIHAKVPGNPLFVFQGPPGFVHRYSGGSYSWNGVKDPSDIGIGYLDRFYQVAAENRQDIVIGSAYAGFDDRMAPWGKNKIILRRCGLTWLDTMKESEKYQQLNGSPLPYLQIMTWNDYEEGTAIEMGIDNCVAGIPATVNNGHLTWSVAFGKDSHGYPGSEQTIAYFRIFTNPSGDKLQELKRVPAGGQHDLDLAPFNLPSGEKFYIEAVGKSQILNHVSEAISVP